MGKIILITWFAIIIIFSTILIYSVFYEIDAYETVINFKFKINEVNIEKNSSTNEIIRLRISASIWNPSSFSSFQFNSIRGFVLLNGLEPEYLHGREYFFRTILPNENATVSWSYPILSHDAELLNEAEENGSWSWYFIIQVFLDSNIVGKVGYDRSQPFQGVKVITS
ncbi:MAG: hypothetical protein ACFE9L_01315 [Candidatus Hodarchaeota archaeon]